MKKSIRLPRPELKLNAAQAAAIRLFDYHEETDSFGTADPNGSGYHARWWGRDAAHGERIYFETGRRDVKVWIEFANPNTLESPQLKVKIDDCGQAPNWYISQANKVRDFFEHAEQAVLKLSAELKAVPLGVPASTEDAEYREIG